MIEWARSERLPCVLVLEDDAGFIERFDRHLEAVVSELPENWDALWLGGQAIKSEPYSPMLKRLIKGTGLFGVIFRETIYDKLIRSLSNENELADVGIAKTVMPNSNCFRTNMNLVIHKPGVSTIKNKFVDYPELR